jgi:hypothetical protein
MDLFSRRRLLFILLLGFSLSVFKSVALADSFDVPLKKRALDFGLSQNNPPGGHNFRVKLYCFFYPTVAIKEYDNEGAKGAEWMAIVPIRKGVVPACARAHALEEKIIKWPEWSGYFKGVKGNLVFFDASDDTDGGLPFVIYDSRTGNKIFEDSAYESTMWTHKVKDSPFDHLRVSGAVNGDLTLKYLRVVEADCDVHAEKAACWEQVRKKLGLKDAEMPVCTAYENISSRWVSAVAYPVEVSLSPQPTTKAIAGPVNCWPVD